MAQVLLIILMSLAYRPALKGGVQSVLDDKDRIKEGL